VELKTLEKARAAARKAIRDADRYAAVAGTHPPAKEEKAILALQGTLLEAKKNHAIALADRKRSSHGPPEQLDLLRKLVEEISATLERLRWAIAQRRAAAAIREAGDALDRMRASAERALTLPSKPFARRAIVAQLDREMDATKRRVAVTIADAKRFAASHAGMLEPGNETPFAARPADIATMASTLAAQTAAVDNLKRRLRDTNDRVEAIKHEARTADVRRRQLK
jgi:hypothetical protein